MTNALEKLNDKHPNFTAFLGTGSGWGSWVLNNLETIHQVIALIGTIAGTIVAVLTVFVKVRAELRKLTRPEPPDPLGIEDEIPMHHPRCDKAPPGWRCTRAHGHAGPCAAEPQPPA